MAVIKQFFIDLKIRNQILFSVGTGFFLLFALFLIGYVMCQYSIYQLCHWLKAGKFTISFAIYAFTIGWFLDYLKDSLSEKTIKFITWTLVFLMLLEMSVIMAQVFLSSNFYLEQHIPEATTNDWTRILFLLGNIFIITNSAITAFIGLQFFRNIDLKPTEYLWAIRISFILFFISCFLGIFIVDHYGANAPEPNTLGIPFTNFSTPRTNLISMHFIGIHLMQILPLATYFFQKYLGKKFLLTIAAAYSVICIALILKV